MITLAGIFAFVGAVGVSSLFIKIAGFDHKPYEPSHSDKK